MRRIIVIALILLGIVWVLGNSSFPVSKYQTSVQESKQTNIATTSSVISTGATSTYVTIQTKTTTKAKPVAVKSKPMTSVTPPTTEPPPNFELINTFARKATVNIFCTTKGGELSPISGTGVVVEPNGLILTNAHVGQYFLLRDFRQKDFIQCIIRTGSPAYPRYNAELVYISPTWVANNKTILKDQNPKGTGENDFAFLRITDAVSGSILPPDFPFVRMDVRENINKNDPVILISYPAGFLGGLSILQDLNITSAITTIKEIYAFKESTADLIAVPGTVISQKGSSGGAVIDKYATLIGLISTSSSGDTTSERALNAITLAYINRSMQNELGITLEQFVSQDITDFAKKFQTTNVPNLTKLIIDELTKNP